MARLKIKDAPLLTNVIGTEKIPTGSRGDFAITPDMLTQYFINKIPFVTQAQLVSVKAELEAKITTVETTLSQSISLLDGRVSAVESAMLGFTQDLTLHKADRDNPHNVTKQQIGLGSVDNTSDINKPISTATKNYVDERVRDSNKGYNLDYYVVGKSYPLHSEIMLTNGVVVKSIVDKNTVNPNESMVGWVSTNSTKYIVDENGVSQDTINNNILNRIKSTVNLDDFKTSSNTDTDAYKDAFDYCLRNNIPNLEVTRNTTLTERVYCYQSDFTVNFNGTTVTYVGEGQDNLRFSAFNIFGEVSETQHAITTSQTGYSTTFTISDTSSFSVGDDVLLKSSSIVTPLIYLGHLVRITNISGNTITVDTVIHLSLDSTNCYISKVNAVKNTNFLNINFTATNQTSRSNGVTGVMFEYTFNCKASVSCEGLWFKGIRVARSNAFGVIGGTCQKPMAFDGGEGYGGQFEYCVNSYVENLTAYNMRHCFDVTASWNITLENCYDYYSMSSSFGTHKAFEYDITFINCHSIGSKEHGFYFGSAQYLFGQTSTKIKMKNCTVIRSRNTALAYTTLGNWITVEDCILDPIPSNGVYSAVIANNDAEFINTRFTSGVSIVAKGTENAWTGGYCKFTNCSVNSNANVSRSFVVGVGASVVINGGYISGMMTARQNCLVELKNCEWFTSSVTGWLDSTQDLTQTIELSNVKLSATHSVITNYTYDWKVKSLKMSGVNFSVPVEFSNRHRMSNVTTTITDCIGAVSMILDGTSTSRFTINNNTFTSINSLEIIGSVNTYALTSPVYINNNTLIANSASASVVVLATTTTVIPRLSVQNNVGVGRLRCGDTNVTKCIVTNNFCEGSHILPTHNGVNKIVASNI